MQKMSKKFFKGLNNPIIGCIHFEDTIERPVLMKFAFLNMLQNMYSASKYIGP